MRDLIIALAEELYINEHDRSENVDCQKCASWAIEAAIIFYNTVEDRLATSGE